MKKTFLSVAILVVCFLVFWGCQKESPSKLAIGPDVTLQPRAGIKIYTACWEEWGRTSQNCEGWGLCEFEDCWFWQDPCCGEEAYSGVIDFDDDEEKYFLTIKLANRDFLEIGAALSELPLYIDEDIIEEALDEDWSYLKIEAGVYPYLPNIGSNGGYRIPIIIIE